MRRWFEGGAGGSGESAGDGAPAPAVTDAAGGSGAEVEPAASEAQESADSAREAMLAEAAEHGRRAAREEWARLSASQPTAPAAPPPTANRREVAELQAEAASLQQERVSLNQARANLAAAIARDGLTAQNLYDRTELADRNTDLTGREARFAAQVNLVGLQESERRQAVSARAAQDDDARKKAWNAFAAEHSSVDPDLLRDAFEKRWEREHPAAAPARTPPAPAPNGRSAVNVSGPSEVSAREVRARTMTREQANQHRATLRSEGRDRDAAAFDRDIRNGKVLVKG